MKVDQSNPWIISEEDFPHTASTAEKLRFLLQYAILAPSSHNSQPWKFKLQADCVEVYADRTRALPVVDPDDRELTISCGAAVYFLHIAMRHYGWTGAMAILPDSNSHDLLARVQLGEPKPPSPAEDCLFYAIPKRRTTRLAYEPRTPSVSLLDSLEATASEHGVWLHSIEDDKEKNAVAQLIAQADRLQMALKPLRRELAAWIHPARSKSHDGMPGYALGMPALLDFATIGFAFVLRTFDIGNGIAARDEKLAAGSPVLLVLGTHQDNPAAWLNTGIALAAVLLRACAEGVTASYLNQPCEIPHLRSALCTTIHKIGFAQLILRLGYSSEVPPTPRRSVDEALES